MKKLLACFCAVILMVNVLPSALAAESEALRAADALAMLEIVQGTASGEYALEAPATRAQAAVLLTRLTASEQAAKEDMWFTGFRDVPAWAYDAIMYTAHQGWTEGVSQNAFAPNEAVDADTWFASLLRALGYSDGYGALAEEDAAAFAWRIGLADREWSGPMTRGELFTAAVCALAFPYRGTQETLADRIVEAKPSLRTAANALGLLGRSLTARQAADRLTPAVFRLDLFWTNYAYDNEAPDATSSGFFISEEGLAVTNYHSIDGSVHALAALSTGESYQVERVLYYDEEIDIAVLRVSRVSVKGKETPAFKYLELAGSEGARPGDPVYTLGNPLGLGLAVSAGIISAVNREVDNYALPCIMNTADISKGSSGGALLNVRGQVIGVTSGAYSHGNSMYLAIPVDPVMEADLTVEGMTLPEVVEKQYPNGT